MSQERRKRQQQRQVLDQPNPARLRSIIIAIVIVVVFAAAYYLIWHKRTSRLDAFAKCLTAKQAKMYGAFWCQHCDAQKEKFGSSFQYAPYVECGIKGSRGIEPVCTHLDLRRWHAGRGRARIAISG
jgi:hypothetical protein